jgi:hypothetical protein
MLETDPVTAATYCIDPATGNPVLIVVVGQTIPVSTDAVRTDRCATPDGGLAVGAAFTGMFGGSEGVSYDTIMAWHESPSGGFGVIAQALFMAQALESTDPALVVAITAAKQSKDFSAFQSDYGVPADVNNWGRLKKYVMSEEVKSMTDLGAVMSGRATPLVAPLTSTTTITTTTTVTTDTGTKPGNGNGKAKGQNGGGNGNGSGNNGGGNGNGKYKGN